MPSSSTFLALLTLLPLATAHLRITLPPVWGDKGAIEAPLNGNTQNWFCAGKTEKDAGDKSKTTLEAGKALTVPVLCDEAAGNPNESEKICSNDPNAWHSGGGCALSIAYKSPNAVKPEDFIIFSSNHACPTYNFKPIDFQIPPTLPACEDCVCAWTWIPQAAQDEMYMNCFDCRVVSNTNGTLTGPLMLKDHYWAVPGYGGKGNRPLYKDALPNGPVNLTVTAATKSETPTADNGKGSPVQSAPGAVPTNATVIASGVDTVKAGGFGAIILAAAGVVLGI